jgi:hypothetical protein
MSFWRDVGTATARLWTLCLGVLSSIFGGAWSALRWVATAIWGHITAIVTAALVLSFLSLAVASYNAFVNPPNSWIRRHIWPLVDLDADRRELSIGDQALLAVKVNTLPVAGQYKCRWAIPESRPGDNFLSGIRQDNCDPVPLQNFGVAFRPGEGERDINISVEVISLEGKQIGHDAITLRLLNRLNPEIAISPDATLRVGETAQISGRSGAQQGSAIAPPYHCAWIIGGKAINEDSCSTGYKAVPRVDSPVKEIVDIRLVVRDSAGNVVGEAQRKLAVVWPRGDFYVYAIETTERMDHQAGGLTLATAVSNLQKTILSKSMITGSLGLKAFGRADPPDNRQDCGLVDDLYSLNPIDEGRVKQLLAGIKVNGYRAPILQVAAESVKELTTHAQQNVGLYLVMIAGGPDACGQGANDDDTLTKLAAVLGATGLQVRGIEIDVLGLTLRLASREDAGLLIERIWNSAPARGEIPYFELVVTNDGSLNDALSSVAGLSNPNLDIRRSSCSALVSLLRQQAELPDRLRERPNPQAARMQAWCRRLH